MVQSSLENKTALQGVYMFHRYSFSHGIYMFHLQGKVKDIELKGHTDSVDQLCWDPKHPDVVATAAGDKTVRFWDARSKFLSDRFHFNRLLN